MSIREATSADLDAVAALRLEFLAEHRGVDPTTFTTEFRATTREFLRRHSESGTSRTWLAVRDGAAVGVVTMLLLDLAPRPEDISGLEGYIINMYVAPRHRRQGLGQELLTACHREADRSRLRRLVLYATDDGAPLYERVGFRHNERWMELPL